MDNAKKTGAGGGKDCKLNELDMEVLDVIGKESPTIIGLGVPESQENESSTDKLESSTSHEIGESEGSEEENHESHNMERNEVANVIKPLRNTVHRRRQIDNRKEENEDVDEKRKLQIELLKINIYKAKLEARQLELSMGLPKSHVTKDIPDIMVVLNDLDS